MRRADREITDFEEIVAILRKCNVCRVAMFDDEYPYILPLNYGMKVENGVVKLYFHGAMQGTKYELVARNNHVSFEVDCEHEMVIGNEAESCTWGMAYKSVIGRGILEIVPDDEKIEALTTFMNHFGQKECRFNPKVVEHTGVMKLTVTSLTGKQRVVPKR